MIQLLFSLIGSSALGKWLAGAAVALAGALGIYMAGRRDAAQRAKIRGLEANIKTREAVENAPKVDNPDDARRILHDLAK